MHTSSPETILQTVFGYSQFKPLQREVIENVLKKRDTLVIMPTGGGKSLCYQIPALLFPGLTVVISPLIALMKDQVEQLREWGVPALFLNSSLSSDEYRENMEQIRAGKIKLLYVAPETLMTTRLFNLLSTLRVDCLTIDEAHCISEWGHDFRPEYRQLVEVRQLLPEAVCLALTATATPQVREDIQSTLRFEAENEFVASFNRENLFIEVAPKADPLGQTLEFLGRFPDQSGIIYCFSRKQVDDLATFLTQRGYSVRPYHAGLTDAERKENQELFIRDDVQIIVATIAFGMGINKPNVRFIVHYDLPKSVEGYYQEIGRAGRDGLPAHCLLLYSYGDAQKLKYFIEQKEEPERQAAYKHLQALTQYAEHLETCRRTLLLAYFGEEFSLENCGMCDNCLTGEDRLVDITIPAQKFLSCVKRTGELFGPVHIVDVLLGAENQKILKHRHQHLSTYGIGTELSRKQWLHIGRQMVQKGLLVQDDRYGSLKLSSKAYEALKNRETILGVIQEEKAAQARAKKAGVVDYDANLFEVLRKKRKELADAAQVPPYVIFSDRSLIEMAAYFPVTPSSFMKINGVGQVKAARYGEPILEIIRTYCQEHNLGEKLRPTHSAPADQGQMELNARHTQVGRAYNEGQSVQQLMEHYQVQRDTILEHLHRFAQEGNSLRSSDEFLALSTLSAGQQAAVMEAFRDLGTELLRPIFERMNGSIQYDELRLLRLHYLSKHSILAP